MRVTSLNASKPSEMNQFEASAFDPADMMIANEADIHHASRALKAMAHPLRLKILCILGSAHEVSVQDIVDMVGTSQSNISQHLSILRDKGILECRKDANKVFYRVAQDKILHLMLAMREAFCPNAGAQD